MKDTKRCPDCRHWFDWTLITNTHGFPLGPHACESPELRKYLAVDSQTGFQNRTANADTCRDVVFLCGPTANWFEPK